jgi:hypothetical protein
LTDHKDLRPGGLYTYQASHPPGCAGHLYRLHRFVLDVPSRQTKVLVEAKTGADKGLWFTCSVANFCTRYRYAPGQEEVGDASRPAEAP